MSFLLAVPHDRLHGPNDLFDSSASSSKASCFTKMSPNSKHSFLPSTSSNKKESGSELGYGRRGPIMLC